MHSPWDPAIPFLRIYPRNRLAKIGNDVCAAPFVIAKARNDQAATNSGPAEQAVTHTHDEVLPAAKGMRKASIIILSGLFG